MTSSAPKRKRILAALLIPGLLFLASCKSDNTIEITSDGGVKMTMDMVDDEGAFTGLDISCDQVKDMFAGEGSFGSDAQVNIEDISDGDQLGCRLSIAGDDAVDGSILVDNGDTFTLTMNGDDFGGITESDLSEVGTMAFTFNIIMPGKITESSDGASVSGNTATYSDPNVLVNGFEVTGLKDGSGSGSGSSSSSGMPVWIWGLIGLVVVGGVVVVIILMSNRKKTPPALGTPEGGYNQYGQQPNPFDQPQAPQGYGQPDPIAQPQVQPEQPTQAPNGPFENLAEPTEDQPQN